MNPSPVQGLIRILPRLRRTNRLRSAPPPPEEHERRILSLQGRYEALGLCWRNPRGGDGKGRPVIVGGNRYPSARAAERAIGASAGAVSVAIHRGQRCRGMKCEWAE